MLNVLVTGGSGFLGSHVCDELIKKRFRVINFDLLKRNDQNEKIKYINGDLTKISDINKIKNSIDYIFHFAGFANLNLALKRPLDTFSKNIEATINLLNFAKKKKIKKFIFASSIYVNSKEGGFYKSSKVASESYVKEFQNIYGINYTILRFGSLYGSRPNPENGVYNLIKNALKNKKITYIGNPEATREYIHVKDAARCCMEILDKKYSNKIINITGHTPIKVSEFLKTIAEIMSINKKKVIFKNRKYPGHYVRTPYSIDDEISHKLTLSTHIDLGEGIKDLIKQIKYEL
tara:strand:+ start:1509 stop:2381 length:873 start_codon:yes stop_codon:yes gene_type:complete